MSALAAVYHFTCTARLPWIIDSAELRPGRNQIGNHPDPDFLWATTNSQGDRTASGMQGYRKGVTALVRLRLPAEDFEEWPAITSRFPKWTDEAVRRLENAARRRGQTNISCWRVRAEPLPLSRILSAEAKTYSGQWHPIELTCFRPSDDPDMRALIFDRTMYVSIQETKQGHASKYMVSATPL